MLPGDVVTRYERGRSVWPGIDVTLDEFAVGGANPAVDPEEWYIACACARGDAPAIAAFERRYFPHIDHALARLRIADDVITEVKQILRNRLFVVAGETEAKVLAYAGRGELEGLVRVAAVRAALDHLRATGRFVDDQPLAAVPAPESDVELRVMRSIDSEHFKTAFADAIAALPERDRTLLRLQLVDGLNIDAIGAAYGVHRATAARWLSGVRETIAKATRKHLVERLDLDPEEVEELVQSVQSRLELTVSRLLRGA